MSELPPSRPLAAIVWMFVTGLCFVAVTALVKLLGPRIPAVEAAFLRYLLGFVFVLPMLWQLRGARIDWATHRLFALRGVQHSVAVGLWFYAMARIPIAEVTALNYLTPVYVTLGAALILGEKLALRRLLAVGVALLGALIVLRPGLRELGPGQVAMLGAGLAFGGSYLTTKVLSGRASAGVVVAMLSLWVTLGLAPAAILHWVAPTGREVLVLLGVALFATAGHYTMTLALAAAPVAVSQPVTFLQLVWATLLGVAVFGEPLDGFVVTGGTLILLSVSYIAWREAHLKRVRIKTPDVAP